MFAVTKILLVRWGNFVASAEDQKSTIMQSYIVNQTFKPLTLRHLFHSFHHNRHFLPPDAFP